MPRGNLNNRMEIRVDNLTGRKIIELLSEQRFHDQGDLSCTPKLLCERQAGVINRQAVLLASRAQRKQIHLVGNPFGWKIAKRRERLYSSILRVQVLLLPIVQLALLPGGLRGVIVLQIRIADGAGD